jgi:hypothetical protein
MINDHAHGSRPSTIKGYRAGGSAPDERDARSERLEHVLEEERQAAVDLRETNQALRFQLDVLEKSYAKQLDDARRQCADTERRLAAQQADFAALDAECRETMRLLAQTRDFLNGVAEERARSGRYTAPGDGRRPDPNFPSLESPAEGTINELIADEPRRRASGDDAEGGSDPARDSPAADMIAPELVFTDEDNEGEDRPHHARL